MGIFDVFCSHDLGPMTLIYKLDPYSLEIYEIRENEFPTSKLSKAIVLQTDTQTDRQTDTTEITYFAAEQRKVAVCWTP